MKTKKKRKDKNNALFFLKQQSLIAKKWITLSTSLGFLNGLLFIFQAYCLSAFISNIYIAQQSIKQNNIYLILLLLIMLFKVFLVYYKEIVAFNTANLVKVNLRKKLLTQLLVKAPKNTLTSKPAELSAIMIDNIEAMHDYFAFYLPQKYLVVLIPIAILMVVFSLNWVAGSILLITAPLIPLFMALVGLGAKSASEKNFKSLARLGNKFLDLIQGMATLKYFNQTNQQIHALTESTNDYRKKTMEVLRIAFLSSAVLEFFASISIALLATYLGLSFLGHLNIGYYHKPASLNVALFILLLAPEFYLPLRKLGQYYHAKQQAHAASEILMPLVKNEEPQTEKIQKSISTPIHINFKQVTFQYPESHLPNLTQINLTINAGEKVAIVGASGAGKSTFINLILGFIQPTAGQVLINDDMLSESNLTTWQKNITWLGQNPRLIFGSLEKNLRIAKPQASDAELLAACKICALDTFILSHPKGLNLPIGEKHIGLSGGQAQRIALARAYLKDAPILLLDEPTANLDANNSKTLHQSLQSIIKNKTAIISTHRKETAALADKLILLDAGRIIAQGSYCEVIQHPLLTHWQYES